MMSARCATCGEDIDRWIDDEGHVLVCTWLLAGVDRMNVTRASFATAHIACMSAKQLGEAKESIADDCKRRDAHLPLVAADIDRRLAELPQTRFDAIEIDGPDIED